MLHKQLVKVVVSVSLLCGCASGPNLRDRSGIPGDIWSMLRAGERNDISSALKKYCAEHSMYEYVVGDAIITAFLPRLDAENMSPERKERIIFALEYAAKVLENARRKDDSFAEINRRLGGVYSVLADLKSDKNLYKKSAANMERYISAGKGGSIDEIYLSLGEVYEELGQNQKAIEAYTEYLRKHIGGSQDSAAISARIEKLNGGKQ